MKQLLYEKTIVDFAHDIIDMNQEIVFLRQEIERLIEYENKYNELLNSNIQHGKTMISNLLKASINMDGSKRIGELCTPVQQKLNL